MRKWPFKTKIRGIKLSKNDEKKIVLKWKVTNRERQKEIEYKKRG